MLVMVLWLSIVLTEPMRMSGVGVVVERACSHGSKYGSRIQRLPWVPGGRCYVVVFDDCDYGGGECCDVSMII
jgi:hypothetical protein